MTITQFGNDLLKKKYNQGYQKALDEVEKMSKRLEIKFSKIKCDEESCSACSNNHAIWVFRQQLKELREK